MLTAIPLLAFLLAPPADTTADTRDRVGLKIRGGGRYDDVRMCVATPAGVLGGPAGDISFFVERALGPRLAVQFDIPVMRPILFVAASQMLQFEPSAFLLLRSDFRPRIDFVGGPMLGLSLHYGPGPDSEPSGEGRTQSFYAAGPILGGYLGLDFLRPGRRFNFQLGLTPYVQSLFRVDRPNGSVVGGLLDFSFRFGVGRHRAVG